MSGRDESKPETAGAGAPSPNGDVAFGHFLVPRRADGSLWELGRGAMGVTYRAFDTSLRTEVALKVIRAEQVAEDSARRRFQREARAAAKIRHPNVASVLYLGEQGGEFFYAMEFIAGRSLELLLKEATTGSLPPAVAIALAAQAAAALNAAHKREVVHRDLKPANLMLLEGDALDHEDERTEAAGNRLLKIIDFGLARSFGAGRTEDSLVTQTFAGFIGTPAYASPEQASGAQDLDGRSDLYSLGVILWQMLTGRLPFTGRVVEVLGKHQFQPPPVEQLAAAHVPAPVVALLTGLLLKDPAERQPQTAGELRSALDRLLRTLSADAVATDVATAAGAAPAQAENIERTSDTTTTPTVGTTLLARYRLGREVGIGDGGRLFLAADNTQGGRPVALKLLPPERLSAEPGFFGLVERALEKLRENPHPILLTQISPGLERSGPSAAFFVREWADGFSLDELLRSRNGELRAAEVFRLLDALPAALDHAAVCGFPLLEVALRKIFVVPAQPPGDNADWPGLRTRPVTDWPAFLLKLNPLGFPPAARVGGSDTPELTRLDATAAPSAAKAPAVALARLTRELLGVPAGGLGPVAALNGDANAVLRRALAPAVGGSRSQGATAFPDAASFWRTLRQAAGLTAAAVATPPSFADDLDVAQTLRAAAAARAATPPPMPQSPFVVMPPPILPPPMPPAPGGRRGGKIALVLAGTALVAFLGWWLGTRQAPEQRSSANGQVEAEQRSRETQEAQARRDREAAEAKTREEQLRLRELSRQQAKADLMAAKSALELAQKDLDQDKLLQSKGLIRQEWLDQKLAGVRYAEANVQLRELTLKQLSVLDPTQSAQIEHEVAEAKVREQRYAEELRRANELVEQKRNSIKAEQEERERQAAAKALQERERQAALAAEQAKRPKVLNVPGDYATIQAALDAARPGDTVLVGPGIYKEALQLNGRENIELHGVDRDKVIVRQDAKSDSCLSVNGCRSGHVHGITFERPAGDAPTHGWALVILTASAVEMSDCVVRRAGLIGIWITGHSSDGTGPTVSNCTVEDCGTDGFYIDGNGTRATLQGNISQRNKLQGISYAHGAAGRAEGNTCDENGNGIACFHQGTNVYLARNTCRRNKSNGIAFEGASGTAQGNVCEDNTDAGISVSGSNSSLTANRCTGNKWGIYKKDGAQPRIAADNVVRGNKAGQIGP